jgi:hypothetical protein
MVKLDSPHDLRAEEQDRQRDGGVQRRRRDRGDAEGGHRQRDRVGDGERGHRLQQHPAVAHDQQQAEHEQQVIDAEQDVLDAEVQISAHPAPRVAPAAQRDLRLHRLKHVRFDAAVGVLHPDQDVGHEGLEPFDGERLPGQAAFAFEACREDPGGAGAIAARFAQLPAVFGKHRHERHARIGAAQRRQLPQHVDLARRCFPQFEEAGLQLVRSERRRDEQQRRRACNQPAEQAPHGLAAAGIGILIVYLARNLS